MSDAKIVDAQCGMESAGGTLLAALAGINMISGAGMMDFESCQSLEKLVHRRRDDRDGEAAGARASSRATSRSRSTLFQKLGHRAEYLAEPHTLKWFAKELYLPSPVIDRATSTAGRARARRRPPSARPSACASLVAAYQPPAGLRASSARSCGRSRPARRGSSA